MRKIACTLLVFLVALFAADRLGSMAMEWVFRHSNDVLSPKLRHLADGVDEDVVLLGASRCHHHYVPSVIADSLGLSVYNAGVGGADNIYSHYIVLCHVLASHAPKVVCLEVMPTDVNQQAEPFTVTSFFAPLYGRNAVADSIFLLAGTHWRYRLSHLYRYNAKASSMLWGLVLNRQRGSDNGYIPLERAAIPPSSATAEKPVGETDSLKLSYLKRFADLCRQHGTQLVLTISPKFTLAGANHYDALRQFARDNALPLLDYHTPGLYLDHPEYFKDVSHLCDEGARVFSSLFAHDLKEVMEDSTHICIFANANGH
ncbi:MAG: hypothetical protein J5529_04190 [Prevotella sp.]|nr:hypothetical protein [Prevotella sp.]